MIINRPDGIGTVLGEERERFDTVKDRLTELLLKQLREFRYIFPFGRPEGKQVFSHEEQIRSLAKISNYRCAERYTLSAGTRDDERHAHTSWFGRGALHNSHLSRTGRSPQLPDHREKCLCVIFYTDYSLNSN